MKNTSPPSFSASPVSLSLHQRAFLQLALWATTVGTCFLPAMAAPLECPQQSKSSAIEQVTKLWQEFLRALASNQAEKSLQFASTEFRPTLAAVFLSPNADLPAFAAKVKRFDVVDVMPCIVQAYVTRDTEEGERLFPMLFGMRSDGTWVIASL